MLFPPLFLRDDSCGKKAINEKSGHLPFLATVKFGFGSKSKVYWHQETKTLKIHRFIYETFTNLALTPKIQSRAAIRSIML